MVKSMGFGIRLIWILHLVSPFSLLDTFKFLSFSL